VESGDCGFETLYAADRSLDAIFVCNDQMSLGVIQAANRNGLRIPGDLGIVGFDDIPESKFFSPSLTTIHQPANRLGALAVTHMRRLIQKDSFEEKEESLPACCIVPELVVRESSARK